MAVSYYNSSQITVFPSTSRVYDPTGKFTSEHNFINILNSLIDHEPDYSVSNRVLNDGCVLKYYTGTAFSDTDVRATKFCFIIHGYYFELDSQPTDHNLYFGICVSNDDKLLGFGGNSSLDGMVGSSSQFLGLVKTTSTSDLVGGSTGTTNYWLQVTDNVGNLVNTVRFKSNSIEYTYTGTQESRPSTTVFKELNDLNDKKQDNLNAGNGILFNVRQVEGVPKTFVDIRTDLYNYIVDLASKNLAKDDLNFLMIDNGQFKINELSKGGFSTATNELYKHIIVQNGKVAEGQTIYASQQGADDSVGNDGDIWYKYS